MGLLSIDEEVISIWRLAEVISIWRLAGECRLLLTRGRVLAGDYA